MTDDGTKRHASRATMRRAVVSQQKPLQSRRRGRQGRPEVRRRVAFAVSALFGTAILQTQQNYYWYAFTRPLKQAAVSPTSIGEEGIDAKPAITTTNTTPSVAEVVPKQAVVSRGSRKDAKPDVTSDKVPILVWLSGQMGNFLSLIAHGRGLQLWLQEEYSMESELVVRGFIPFDIVGSREDLLRAGVNVHQCFPKLRHWNTTAMYEPTKRIRVVYYEQQQERWLEEQANLERLQQAGNSDQPDSIRQGLDYLTELVQRSDRPFMTDRNAGGSTTRKLPFLTARHYVMADIFLDRYFEEYRRLFEFDYQACCKELPEPDETVFHYRNFVSERLRLWKLGYQELSPNKTAWELFGHLQPGDKVAITTPNAKNARHHARALRERGLQVRIVRRQTDVEDFCFLLGAQKELVGVAESTFVHWAGYLGNASKVRLYSLDSHNRRSEKSLFRNKVFRHYNFTNPSLRSRIKFELYQSEGIDRSLL